MSNVIAFLESLGRNPDVLPGSVGFTASVRAQPLDDEARAALLAGDTGALNDLIGGRPTMLCLLFPAEGDEQKKDDEVPAEDVPDEQKEQIGHGMH